MKGISRNRASDKPASDSAVPPLRPFRNAEKVHMFTVSATRIGRTTMRMQQGRKNMLRAKVLLAAVLAVAAGSAQAETVTLKTNLAGAAEVPPVNSSAKGAATVMVDTAAKKATWKIDYSGLSGPP